MCPHKICDTITFTKRFFSPRFRFLNNCALFELQNKTAGRKVVLNSSHAKMVTNCVNGIKIETELNIGHTLHKSIF